MFITPLAAAELCRRFLGSLASFGGEDERPLTAESTLGEWFLSCWGL